MKTYEQDYKTTIRCSFSDPDKFLSYIDGFFGGDDTIENAVQNITRSFHHTPKGRDKETNNWFKFVEGVGVINLSKDDYETYIHESEEAGIIKIWYEEDFEDYFSVVEI